MCVLILTASYYLTWVQILTDTDGLILTGTMYVCPHTDSTYIYVLILTVSYYLTWVQILTDTDGLILLYMGQLLVYAVLSY
jgi:hypothetical protein